MRLANMTIPLGAQVSNAIDVSIIDEVTVYGPAVLTGTATVEVSPDDGITWYPTAVTVAVDTFEEIDNVRASLMRLSSDMAELADRAFMVYGSDKKRA